MKVVVAGCGKIGTTIVESLVKENQRIFSLWIFKC